MFKSKIEVREYAMNKSIELMGPGTPTKQVLEKAKEIESYIVGEAKLPETVDDSEIISSIMGVLTGIALELIRTNTAQSTEASMGLMGLNENAIKSSDSTETSKKK